MKARRFAKNPVTRRSRKETRALLDAITVVLREMKKIHSAGHASAKPIAAWLLSWAEELDMTLDRNLMRAIRQAEAGKGRRILIP